MAEYGFAVSVSAKEYAKDPEGCMFSARRLLSRNYAQSMAAMEDPPTKPPSLCVGTENDDGEIPFCWYIDETGEYGAPWGVIGPLLEEANG